MQVRALDFVFRLILVPRTPSETSTSKPKQTPRSRAKSVGQKPLFMDDLLTWDKRVLAQVGIAMCPFIG